MDSIFLIFFIPILGGVVWFILYSRTQKRLKKKLKTIAHGYGLNLGKSHIFQLPLLHGTMGSMQVYIQINQPKNSFSVRCTLKALNPGPAKMRIFRPEAEIEHPGSMVPVMQTGDPVFDGLLKIENNNDPAIRGMLNQETRRHIISLNELTTAFAVYNSEIHCTTECKYQPEYEKLDRILTLGQQIITRISGSTPTQNRLIDIICSDSCNEVTRLCYAALATSFPTALGHTDLLEFIINFDDPWLKIEAASHLDTRGIPIILSYLHPPFTKWTVKAIEIAGKMKNKEFTRPICAFFTSAHSDYEKKTALKALYDIGDISISPFLLDQFKLEKSVFKVELLKTLKSCGTEEVIPYLEETVSSKTINPIIKGQAKEVIKMIKQRKEDIWKS